MGGTMQDTVCLGRVYTAPDSHGHNIKFYLWDAILSYHYMTNLNEKYERLLEQEWATNVAIC